MSTHSDIELLRRFEPMIRFTRGERFFPIAAERYVNQCSLWVQRPGEEPERLIPEGELTLQKLAEPRAGGFDSVHFLQFIEPLNAAELAAYRIREGLTRKDPKDVFYAGRGRLARVGYGSRFIDALFSLTLLARGRVPGDTAAAAVQTIKQMLEERESYAYHGRVVRQDSWIVLQYWFFYPFNNWRSGFFGANDHEADWEMACIYLSENAGEVTPEWVAFASHEYHGDDLRRRWEDPEVQKAGEHPVIYAGAGSHASYFSPGEYLTELELPFLAPLVRISARLQKMWTRALRLAQGGEETSGNNSAAAFNIFKIPFVDYARGDGISLGPGQNKEWDMLVMLNPEPDWVAHYRGLWGLYAHDPVAGENAPAGPMYNRDGSVRKSWYDPIGWAGLDKVVPRHLAIQQAQKRLDELIRKAAHTAQSIEEKSSQLRALGIEAQAMESQAHLKEQHGRHLEKIAALSDELNELRAELASDQALTDALARYAKGLEAGEPEPMRAHIRRAHHPVSVEEARGGRFAEAWSAISIGLMMVGFVGAVLFAREYLAIALAALVAVIVFVESGFRRRLTRLIQGLTIALAAVAALVMLFEFFWEIVIVGVLLAGGYIMWENLRELWT